MNDLPMKTHQTENVNATDSIAEVENEAETQNDSQPEEADTEHATIIDYSWKTVSA